MIAIFKGGPWDGCSFDIPLLPDQILLRTSCPTQKTALPKGTIDFGQDLERHVYTVKGRKLQSSVQLIVGENLTREPEEGEDICDLVDEDCWEVHFEYTPDSKNWVDTL